MIRRNILSDRGVADQFIEGVLRLKDVNEYPWRGRLSIYDFFVNLHYLTMMEFTPMSQSDRNAAHSGPVFLPWHRYYLLMFEFYLRDATGDDDFRLPYWDWGADASSGDPADSPIWSATYLGGTGSPVRNGPFRESEFRVRLEANPFSGDLDDQVDRGLIRDLGARGSVADTDNIARMVRTFAVYDTSPWNSRSRASFRGALEAQRGMHNSVHVWVAGQFGDMGRSTSPNDPVFFLHHCNVDRIWAAWQERHPNSGYVPGMTESDELFRHRSQDAMFTQFSHGFNVTPDSMIDPSRYYEYDSLSGLV